MKLITTVLVLSLSVFAFAIDSKPARSKLDMINSGLANSKVDATIRLAKIDEPNGNAMPDIRALAASPTDNSTMPSANIDDGNDVVINPQDAGERRVPATSIEATNSTGDYPLNCKCTPAGNGGRVKCHCNNTAPNIKEEFVANTTASGPTPNATDAPESQTSTPATNESDASSPNSKSKYPLSCKCSSNPDRPGKFKCVCKDKGSANTSETESPSDGTTVAPSGDSTTAEALPVDNTPVTQEGGSTPSPSGSMKDAKFPLHCKCSLKDPTANANINGSYKCICNDSSTWQGVRDSSNGTQNGTDGDQAVISAVPVSRNESDSNGTSSVPPPLDANSTGAVITVDEGDQQTCGNETLDDIAKHTNYTFVSCTRTRKSSPRRKPEWTWLLKPNGKGRVVYGKWIVNFCSYGCVEAFQIEQADMDEVYAQCVAQGYELAQPSVDYHTDWNAFRTNETIGEFFRKTKFRDQGRRIYERTPAGAVCA